MNDRSSNIFSSLFLMVVVLVGGGYVLSQLFIYMGRANEMSEQINQQSAQLTAKDEEIASLSAQNAEKDQAIQKYQAALNSEQGLREQAVTAATLCTNQKAEQGKQLAGLITERDSLRQEMAAVKRENAALHQQIDSTGSVGSIPITSEPVTPVTGNDPQAAVPSGEPVSQYVRGLWWVSIPLFGIAALLVQVRWNTRRSKAALRASASGQDEKVQVWMTREQLQEFARQQRKQQSNNRTRA